MEEQTSWRNHSFTLVIFAGIVTLSAIFFVLGMLVGRTQGKQIAKEALEQQTATAPASESAGTIERSLAENAGSKASRTLELPSSSAKQSTPSMSAPKVSADSTRKAEPTPVVSKTGGPDVLLQVFASMDEKKAMAALKQVRSKGFKARIVEAAPWHRVVVGPYKESEVKLAQSDLHAAGYDETIIR